MSFHELHYNARYKTLGDIAESVFEEVWPKTWDRWGIKRPRVPVSSLPPVVRAAADYYDADGFIEVMGCGSDGLIKIKDAKLEALYEWERFWSCRIFVWDSALKRWSIAPLDEITEVVINDGCLGQFHDGPTYTAVSIADWPGEWVSHDG